MRNVYKCGAALIGAALLLSACGGGSDDAASKDPNAKVTLNWWHNAPEEPLKGYWQELADAYTAKHPNVTFKIEPVQNEQIQTKITVALQSNNPPDIFQQWGGGDLATQVESGKVQDITEATKATTDGRLVLRTGRTEKVIAVRSDVFLFREFGGTLYQVKEAALVGGETVKYLTDVSGQVWYLEIEPTSTPTVAENMSPFTNWTTTLGAGAVQSRLSRYVRGIGTLYDVNIKQKGYSRRAVEIEIIGSNGTKTLKGGKIRSALRLKEQLFVINKRYSGNAVASYTFTGRGWGHGVGMCQYGAFGLAKMGVKADEIIKHYYTGVDVAKAY
jgi:hypothetical protein